MKSPTSNTLKLLTSLGIKCQVVEYWNAFARKRRDLFGIIDVVGLHGNKTMGIQTTSDNNISARVNKIIESGELDKLEQCGWLIAVVGWRKKNARLISRTVIVHSTGARIQTHRTDTRGRCIEENCGECIWTDFTPRKDQTEIADEDEGEQVP